MVFHLGSPKHLGIIAMALLCLGSLLVKPLGLDWALTPLDVTQLASPLSEDDLFYALAGTMNHALLEWGSVSFALFGAIVAWLHYKSCRDITMPIIGMALFCAGALDTFHTLAATHLIEVSEDKANFIPFTWAMSRIFNGGILVLAALLSLWVIRTRREATTSHARFNMPIAHPNRFLWVVACVFVLLAVLTISLASGNSLPRTTYPHSMFTRPFDVLPLALFALAAALFWVWHKRQPSLIGLMMLCAMLPEVVTQVHMAFGSTALFDHHFNVAHLLKTLAYGCIAMGIVVDLIYRLKREDALRMATVEPGRESHADNKPSNNTLTTIKAMADLYTVGRAQRPLGILLPTAALALAVSISLVVGLSFYQQSKGVLLEQQGIQLGVKSELVKAKISAAFLNAARDALLLSRDPDLLEYNVYQDASDSRSKIRLKVLKDKFREILSINEHYLKLRFIDPLGNEKINVVKKLGGIFVTPDTQLQNKKRREYFQQGQKTLLGTVTFSRAELNREHGKISLPYKTVVRAMTPVFDEAQGEFSGLVIISIDIENIVDVMRNADLDELDLYLANEQGGYVYHPDKARRLSYETGGADTLLSEFSHFTSALKSKHEVAALKGIFAQDAVGRSSYLKKIDLSDIGSAYPLFAVLQYHSDKLTAALENYRNQSLLMGLSLSLLALSIAIVVSRRVVSPLNQLTHAMQSYESSGELGKLPVDSKDELGVLARSFYNLIHRLERGRASLLNHKEQLQLVVDSTDVGIWDWDMVTNRVEVNEVGAQRMGYELDELSNLTVDFWRNHVHPMDQHNAYLARRAYWQNKVDKYVVDLRIQHKAGHWVWVQESGKVVERDNKGRPLRMIGTHLDVGEQKLAYQAIEKTKQELQNFFDTANSFMCIASNEGFFEKVNKHFSDALGYTEEELLAGRYLEFVHPDDIQSTQSEMSKLSEGMAVRSFVNRYRAKSGHYISLLWSSVPDTATGKVYASAVDITELQKSKQEIERQQELMLAMSQQGRIGAWEVDLVEQVLYWDEMTRVIHEVPDDFEPDIATAIDFYKEGESREKIKHAVESAIGAGKPWNIELQIVTYKGREI